MKKTLLLLVLVNQAWAQSFPVAPMGVERRPGGGLVAVAPQSNLLPLLQLMAERRGQQEISQEVNVTVEAPGSRLAVMEKMEEMRAASNLPSLVHDLIRVGRYEEAAEKADEAVRILGTPKALVARATAALWLGMNSSAQHDAWVAAYQDQTSVDAWWVFSHASLKLGNHESVEYGLARLKALPAGKRYLKDWKKMMDAD